MKIYTKNQDSVQANFGMSLIFSLLFMAPSFGFLVYVVDTCLSGNYSIILDGIFLEMFSLVFLVLGFIIFIFTVSSIFEKPIKKGAILEEKINERYHGRDIIYMTFTIENEEDTYKCYTKNDNPFKVGQKYLVAISRFERIVDILEYDESQIIIDKKVGKEVEQPKENYDFGIKTVFFIILIVFCVPLVVLIGKIIYDFIFLKKSNGDLNFGLIVFTIFVVLIVGYVLKYFRRDKKDFSVEKKYLNKTPILKDKNEYITSTRNYNIKKNMLLVFIVFLISYAMGIFMFLGEDMELGKRILIVLLITAFPFFPVEVFLYIKLLCSRNYVSKYLKKYNIKLKDGLNWLALRHFKILKYGEMNFFVVDENNNLILNVLELKKYKSPIYLLCNSKNKKIGEIRKRVLSLSHDYIVRLIDKKPFIVSNLALDYSYDVIGRNYQVKGGFTDFVNMICDKEGNSLALINSMNGRESKYDRIRNVEVTLCDIVYLNDEILTIAIAVMLGNISNYYMYRNRYRD